MKIHRLRAKYSKRKEKVAPSVISDVKADLSFCKHNYIRGCNVLLDGYNSTLLAARLPLLLKALRYVDIPVTLHWYGVNMVELELGDD